MVRYSIPEPFKNGLITLINLKEDSLKKLIEVIRNTEVGTMPPKLASNISDELKINFDAAYKLSNVIFSFYSLLEFNINQSLDDIANDFCNMLQVELKDHEDFNHDINWEIFKCQFIELLKDSPFNLSYKSMRLFTEYEKVFQGCRVITDIRPIFRKDINEKADYALIVHNLKIEYIDSNRDINSIYIALDTDDLKMLKGIILRAENKESTLRNTPEIKFIDINNKG